MSIDVDRLRRAIEVADDEPFDEDGFCIHGCLGGAGCSVWDDAWPERLADRYVQLDEPVA